MTTVENAIRRVRNALSPSSSATFGRVNGSVVSGGTSIVFDQALSDIGIVPGSIIMPESTTERILVLGTDNVNTANDVVRGHEGTTAVAIGDNTLIRVNEPYDNGQILDALNSSAKQVNDKGVCTPVTTEVTYSADVRGYPFSYSQLLGSSHVLQVAAQTSDSDDQSWVKLRHWHPIYDVDIPGASWDAAIMLDEPWEDGQKIRITTVGPAASATYLAFGTEMSSALLMPASAEEVIILGAIIQLLEQNEAKRNQLTAATDSRNSAEVPPGAFVSGIQLMRQRYQMLLRAEMGKMRQQFPELDWEPVRWG